MSTNLPAVVAALAHEYESALDETRRLATVTPHGYRRLMALERAANAAEAIVLLTDSPDWQTRARAAKKDAEKAMLEAQRHLNDLARFADQHGQSSAQAAVG